MGPRRTCIGCREVKEKRKLLRFVCDGEGRVFFDKGRGLKGRGVYICPNMGCIEKACRGKAMNYGFRRPVKRYTPEDLWSMIDQQQDRANP